QSLTLFKGLTNRPSAQQARAGHSLYDQLFKAALQSLPPGIERLIIVPDAPLNMFPLSALNISLENFRPVARDYEVVVVPSATLWHNGRRLANEMDSRPALVLADPRLDFAASAISTWRSTMQGAGLSLGQLPHARAEGAEIITRLHGRGTLWVGGEASEA